MDGLYERQESLGLARPYVAIVGCGGVGVWAALAIALGGAERVELYDSDDISIHNLNRLPFSLDSLGQPKSVALAGWLSSLRPELDVQARANFEPKLHNFANINWVVCCTDSLKSRKMVHAAAKLAQCNYLELGADGERWTLGYEPPQFSTELEQNAGYQTVPVHVGPCMMAGAAAAYYVLHNCVPSGDHVGQWVAANDKLQLEYYGPGETDEDIVEHTEYEHYEPMEVADEPIAQDETPIEAPAAE